LGIIDKNYSMTVKKGRLSEEQKQGCMSLISGTTDYQDLATADLVIEAVFENLEIKQQVFAKLDKVCKPGAISGQQHLLSGRQCHSGRDSATRRCHRPALFQPSQHYETAGNRPR